MISGRSGPLFLRKLAYLYGSFGDFCVISSSTKNIDLAQKRGVLRADSHMVNVDSRVARFCSDLRCRKARIQAFSSRTGVQEGTRWQSTTPSNQNRILLKHRPHQNLIDNEIWTPWVTFSTKSGVLIGLLLCFVLQFDPQPKTSIWLKKGGSSAQTPIC